jgi:hypothetical protein
LDTVRGFGDLSACRQSSWDRHLLISPIAPAIFARYDS